MLQNLSVRNWLGDIEPAWTLLDQASFDALQRPPHPILGPIRLTYDLPVEDIQRSAVARNTLILLRAAAEGLGLKMTATGTLSRGVVAEMCELFTWPGFDKAEAFRLHKVINEPDFLPLFFVRHVAEAGKLVRRDKGHLKVTPAGQKLLKEPHQKALQAVLFHLALWRLDLGYLGRGLHHGWPQHDIGIVLWSLSIAANDWQPPERLTRMCTIPINGVLESTWDTGGHAMEATVLRPLRWFGLLDYRQDDIPERRLEKRHSYRKTPLFDRFLSFDVKLEAAGPRH
ncbi:MAG: hypothetical protein FJ167_06770 [Gammaproteobacteria bacterium]|nr:hypothetical protein [Phycisphaerae bacterium]MBM4224484.1 hypothetical protein [Gammaproteobacteria bacterium]